MWCSSVVCVSVGRSGRKIRDGSVASAGSTAWPGADFRL